jgi:hypothetical protein
MLHALEKARWSAIGGRLDLFTDTLSHGSSSICKCSDEWFVVGFVVGLVADTSMHFDVSVFFLRQPLNLDSIVRIFIGG